MTAHTPASLLALAREALDLAKYRDRAERESPLPDGNNPRLAAWLAQDRLDQAIRDPALIIALVERLAEIEDCHNCYSCNYDGKDPLEVPLIQSPADHE